MLSTEVMQLRERVRNEASSGVALQDRVGQLQVCSALDEMSVSPPRKIVIFIVYKSICWIKVSKKYLICI